MALMSRENTVLYVDYEYTLKDIWETVNGRKDAPVKRMIGIEPRLREVNTRLNTKVHVLTPPAVLPLNKIRSHQLFLKLLSVNAGIVESAIKYAIRKLKISDPVLVSGFNPYYGSMLYGRLGELLHIYYCYDEIDSGWHRLHGPMVENAYLAKADLVITTSDYLYSRKRAKSVNCHVIKNGVDFEAFHHYAGKAHGARKSIGYTGSVDGRFDIETVSYVISNLPEYDFVFAGRVTNQQAYEKLRQFKNVKLLGSRKPEEVPPIVGSVDLGIVPYVKNSLTQGVYPLKFNEYLAAGKPVVATDFACLPEFSDLVRFAPSREDFLKAVKEELENDSIDRQERRINFARSNSWVVRSEAFSLLIEQCLLKRASVIPIEE